MRTFKRRRVFLILTFLLLVFIYWLVFHSRRRLQENTPDDDVFNIYQNQHENALYESYKIGGLFYNGDNLTITSERRVVGNGKSVYVILEFTRVFKQPKYCHLSLGKDRYEVYKNDETFMEIYSPAIDTQRFHYFDKCKYKNCFFTCDKKRWQHRADAVMFHESDIADEYESAVEFAERSRNASQVWIVYNDEPHEVPTKYDVLKFNWTMSHYTDSDVSYCAYGCYQRLVRHVDDSLHDSRVLDEFQRRKSHALWFNSNCNSKARIVFAGNLANHFPVHIYGGCNEHIKPYLRVQTGTLMASECKRDTECEVDTLSTAKFYLAFESTNCSDYITEKFWRTLAYGLIPVVFQPVKKYYEHVAPLNSFIHAQDFDYNAKKLARFLDQVSEDFELYRLYFEWKKQFKVLYTADDVEPYRMCEFCAKLNQETRVTHYESISKWFNKKCKRE